MTGALLIRNGHVVAEQGVLEEADVLIEDGLISAVGRGLSGRGEILDAAGHYVLPGAVDPHVHVSMEGASLNEPMLDDLEDASRTALHGGTTTIVSYAHRAPGRTALEMIEGQIEVGQAASYTDFALNAMCLPGDDVVQVVADGHRRFGVRTFKALLAYRERGLMMEDDDLLLMMRAAASVGATVLVHAESGRVGDGLEGLARADGRLGDDQLLPSAPGELEADGIFRTAMLARLTGARVLFVHLTSALGRQTFEWVRGLRGGERLSIETQPHYALLTNDEVLARGALAKVGPVLKERSDREAVRGALADGLISHLSSDHSPRMREAKLGAANIFDAPYGGISGTELLLSLAWKLGMEDDLFDVRRLAQVVSTNAARAYGLYPLKGAIRPGSAGDLAIVPVDGPSRAIAPEGLHMRSDYSLYHGIRSSGLPAHVIKDGETVVAAGRLVGRPRGRYLGCPETRPRR